jgi:serine/threonine protein kinase
VSTPEQPGPGASWERIGELFHRALEQPHADRAAFVAREAAGDPALAAEISSLLDAHERAGPFIERAARPPAELDALARAVSLDDRPLGPYRLKRLIGEGGMGVVYLAEDTRLGRLVALKAVTPRKAGDPTRVERLRREARAAASLSHPGIATVYALDDIDGHLYLASEHVEGETLRDELARGPIGAVRARDTGAAIARALGAAHARGVIHRDLKPENIVRTDAGAIKILDFGLARIDDDRWDQPSLTEDGAAPGTPAYMSPEQIRGGPIDARSDLFALGIVIYELATGEHPFRIGTSVASTIASILEDAPAPLVPRLPHPADKESPTLARGLERVVLTALQKAPIARYQSAIELADALDRAGSHPVIRTDATLRFGQEAPDRTNAAVASATAHRPPAARWWWQFHQVTTTTAYLLLLAPLWQTRTAWGSGDRSLFVFLAGVVAVIVAGALRLHLWFASRHYLHDWAGQHRRSRRWIRGADLILSGVLLLAGVAAIRAEAPAILMVASAAAVAVSSTIIEPATTRAAFDPPDEHTPA